MTKRLTEAARAEADRINALPGIGSTIKGRAVLNELNEIERTERLDTARKLRKYFGV